MNSMNALQITVLGSGTSHGVPVIGCHCPVCKSPDPKDRRSRSSVLIEGSHGRLLIDTATEFRLQALACGLDSIDYIAFTHSHADHLHGLDDVRVLSQKKPIDVYASKPVLQDIKKRFDYAFRRQEFGGGVPRLALHAIKAGKRFRAGSLEILALDIRHGRLPILGFRIGDFAYITDCSFIPEKSIEQLQGVSTLMIEGLRQKPHPTHYTIEQAARTAERCGASRTWLTHISHNHSHKQIQSILTDLSDKKIEPAWDGLCFTV